MDYTLLRIKSYRDEKNQDDILGEYSRRVSDDPTEGSIEIMAPRKYHGRKMMGRRIRAATIEFYSKHGFNLTKTSTNENKGELHFERKINFLEKYLISIERQGIHFYIHIIKEQKFPY